MRSFTNPFTAPAPRQAAPKLRIAVVGAGYWGPNLARNLQASPEWDLVAICDLDLEKARRLAATLGDIPVVESLDELLDTFDVDAVAIATPARTHHGTVMTALRAGKHVLVEKPLADSRAHGLEMVAEAEANGLILMADHTYCYTPAVLKMQELVQAGSLGEILFVDSTRINLGLVQPDVDVFWDLAPHDLAILDFVLPGGLNPVEVSAFGADPLGTGRDCVGHLNFRLPNDATAHVHVNWLSPTKIRQMVIGGSQRTLVWDDLNPQQRLSVYDRGVNLDRQPQSAGERAASAVSYRLGDTWSPALPEREALSQVVEELALCIRSGRQARTGGESGLRVLSVLEAATRSLTLDGHPSKVAGAAMAGSGVEMEEVL
ncbi:gfo/Idh/MocA family oxidoreductase [Pseudarthrobacter phenanthrenivorans]|uniref:Gfo/Idh/MocA family oxidoreductase n=1 Tax=Pseudarthrobacter phenanthrenivorans TaxID=361575 RepID=A0A3B0FRY5_PSEPS|nr:Gfo/Idh/MocA family oxidoreductase [Pseudarthrobacter phenanthrenivorans]RKO22600.1 gfo/Idh/MocA family oxidoreductase [Pseudarthrobacter phenanthrenivorans]TPV49807.1 Gfo/Idh/MocA family oxidoreductase [Pseudarthrobacter phenanthrenivorans]